MDEWGEHYTDLAQFMLAREANTGEQLTEDQARAEFLRAVRLGFIWPVFGPDMRPLGWVAPYLPEWNPGDGP